ncbi:MAG: dihydroneopterin aldolase [Bacillota bacterium]
MLCRIKIQEIAVYAYHGVLPQEQELGQQFRVSIELGVELPLKTGDILDETVDYCRAVEVTHRVMKGSPKQLLETLAVRIAEELLEWNRVTDVKVSVHKPHPPIPGVEGGVAVEIFLSRGD